MSDKLERAYWRNLDDIRTYKGVRIVSFVAPDRTTRWHAGIRCRSGCCERMIERGTLASVKRHIDRQ